MIKKYFHLKRFIDLKNMYGFTDYYSPIHDKVEELAGKILFWFLSDLLIINLLLDYVLENYIETNLFPFAVWNQFDNDGSIIY